MKKVWIRLGGVVTADEETMNAILCGNANALIKAIKENGFEVLTHSLSAPNDGGIGLGQALYGMMNR